jgi:phospholipid N-methyltransferase
MAISEFKGTATYSPEDNKLRFYPFSRLSKPDYERIRANGFIWAPKQELFVTPAWSPKREDLLIEWCGEIDDEDKSLVERAEERSERFEDYSDSRAKDSEQAYKGVKQIADGIPLGQPILIGHHSERHAKRDAERIENGMRRSVKMWEQAKYWKQRAAGAIAAAKYKELPAVRARRIKGLESDLRKQLKTKEQAEKFNKAWTTETIELTWDRAREIANFDYCSKCFTLIEFPRLTAEASNYEGMMSIWSALEGIITPEQARDIAVRIHNRTIEYSDRWIEHFSNRLEYEHAMQEACGGIATDKKGPEKGGACKSWVSNRGEWGYIVKVNRVTVTLYDNWGNGGKNFTRTIPFDKLSAVMTKAEVDAVHDSGRLKENQNKTGFRVIDELPVVRPAVEVGPSAPFNVEAVKDTLKAGIKVEIVNQLFPTPRAIAAQLIELADIRPGNMILEPSAGTGMLIGAMGGSMFHAQPEHGLIHAVEDNLGLVKRLRQEFPFTEVTCGDFLGYAPGILFDRIVMNPPFENGADIRHIEHAIELLKDGGKLVAICANGPRQVKKLQAVASKWIELPEGSFKECGTMVRTAIMVYGRDE